MKCLISNSLNAGNNASFSDRRKVNIPVSTDRRQADRRQSDVSVDNDRRRVNFTADNERRWTDRRQVDIFVKNDRRQGDRRAYNVSFTNDNSNNNPNITHKGELFFEACEALPPMRRLKALPDQLQNGNATTALGMASLALINLPEDCRDIRSAFRQLNGGKPSYDFKNYQHSFSFFRGTAIEEWLHKHIDNGNKLAKWFYDNDRDLTRTSFGEKLIKLVGAKEEDTIETEIKDFKGFKVFAMKYGGSYFAKLTARALKRTTKLGLIALALLEIPKIIKSDHKIKQTAKSTVNFASITAGIGYGGAIGAKYGGSTGSLVGMGVGAILGSELSKQIQDTI